MVSVSPSEIAAHGDEDHGLRDVDALLVITDQSAPSDHPAKGPFDDARKRFLSYFPEGFHSTRLNQIERNYKITAREKLLELAPLAEGFDAQQNPSISRCACHSIGRLVARASLWRLR